MSAWFSGSTDGEVVSALTPANFAFSATPIDVRRYGILPNLPALASQNTARLQALLDPTKGGPQGRLLFAPVLGGDTYHFNGPIQVRDRIHMDLMGCRLLFAKAAANSDRTYGCFTFIRDVTIENGTIEANITNTVGVNALPIFRIGSRSGYPFGSFTGGIFDKDSLFDAGLPSQGNIALRNLYLKTNNPSGNCAVVAVLLGGLRNVLIENISLEGSGDSGPECGFYYEMGDGSTNGFPSTPARWSTSHAINLQFRNIRGSHLKITGATPDAAIVTVVEAQNFEVDGVYGIYANPASGVQAVAGLVAARNGEGHYHNAWEADQTPGPRIGIIRNVAGKILRHGIVVTGAGGAVGQFSDANMVAAGVPVLTLQEKIDLIQYHIEGFDISTTSSGNGVIVNAPATVCRGTVKGAFNGIYVQAETPDCVIDSVRVFDSTNIGIRANDASAMLARKKRVTIRNSKVCGSVTSAAIAIDNAEGAYVGQCQLGYATAKGDPADESTQTTGVFVGADANGVTCDTNYVKTNSGTAYVNQGNADRGCNIVNPLRESTSSANLWQLDGVSRATQGSLTSISHQINTTNKYLGKKVWDTTNNVMRYAEGSATNSTWRGVDGSGVLTPV